MHKIRVTPAAGAQLKDIWFYSADAWGQAKADEYLLDISEALKKFERNPMSGRSRPDIRKGYHSIRVNSHIVFYMIHDTFIDVIGVLHERMDVGRLL